MSDTSLPGLLLRMVVSLGVVLGLMLIASRLLSGRWTVRGLPRTRPPNGRGGVSGNRRTARVRGPRPMGRTTNPDALQIIARQSFGRTLSVQVIQACGRTLVLGVGADSVTLLATGDEPLVDPRFADVEDDEIPTSSALAPRAWKPVLDAVRDRTVRRT